jgi:hypothetical protein
VSCSSVYNGHRLRAIHWNNISLYIKYCSSNLELRRVNKTSDSLCGLVVKSSWLHIRRPGFDSRHYQKTKIVGLERVPLSLVSTTEELLDRKLAAPVYKTENTAVGIRHADHVTPSIRKSWH